MNLNRTMKVNAKNVVLMGVDTMENEIEEKTCVRCGTGSYSDLVEYCTECDAYVEVQNHNHDYEAFRRDHGDHNIVYMHSRCYHRWTSKRKAEEIREYKESFKDNAVYDFQDDVVTILERIPHVNQIEDTYGERNYPECQDGSEHDMIEKGQEYLIFPRMNGQPKFAKPTEHHYGWSLGGHQLDTIDGPVYRVHRFEAYGFVIDYGEDIGIGSFVSDPYMGETKGFFGKNKNTLIPITEEEYNEMPSYDEVGEDGQEEWIREVGIADRPRLELNKKLTLNLSEDDSE